MKVFLHLYSKTKAIYVIKFNGYTNNLRLSFKVIHSLFEDIEQIMVILLQSSEYYVRLLLRR